MRCHAAAKTFWLIKEQSSVFVFFPLAESEERTAVYEELYGSMFQER